MAGIFSLFSRKAYRVRKGLANSKKPTKISDLDPDEYPFVRISGIADDRQCSECAKIAGKIFLREDAPTLPHRRCSNSDDGCRCKATAMAIWSPDAPETTYKLPPVECAKLEEYLLELYPFYHEIGIGHFFDTASQLRQQYNGTMPPVHDVMWRVTNEQTGIHLNNRNMEYYGMNILVQAVILTLENKYKQAVDSLLPLLYLIENSDTESTEIIQYLARNMLSAKMTIKDIKPAFFKIAKTEYRNRLGSGMRGYNRPRFTWDTMEPSLIKALKEEAPHEDGATSPPPIPPF